MSFKGLEETSYYLDVLAGQALIGQLWSLAVYGKGLQHQNFLDSGPFTSERFQCSSSGYVPVLWFGVCVGWVVEISAPGANGGEHSLLCECFRCMACGFGLLPLRKTQYPVRNRIEPF